VIGQESERDCVEVEISERALEDVSEDLNKEFIRIDDLHAVDNKLFAKLCFSDKIRRYFKSDRLFVTFDQKIEKINKSILSIPALSAVVPVAWAVGADVYLESIDACFLRSLKNVESIFRKWFPRFLFSTEIHVDHVISDASSGSQCALLFSGGLDSLSSYLWHKEEKPTLISIWGGDIPLTERKYWNLVKGKLQAFANREGLNIHFVKTNARELLNEELLARNFLGKKSGACWYGDVTHGLFLVSAAGPLLTPEFATLLVASDEFKHSWEPYELGSEGSLLFHYTDVFLGNTRVVYDTHGLSRLEKVKHILKGNSLYCSNLIVCTSDHRFFVPPWAPQALNCCECEKCLRTLAELALENIDPASCDLSLGRSKDAFKLIKNLLSFGLLTSDRFLLREEWKDMQNNIVDTLGNGNETGNRIPGSREFFEWFKTFDLDSPVSAPNNRLSTILHYCFSAKYKGSKYAIGFLLWTIKRRIMQRAH
jgi:hypothetical protein